MLSFTTDAAQNVQSMRLRDDPPPITQPARPSKKRKSPPTKSDSQKQLQAHQLQQPQQPAQAPPAQTQTIQVLPPPHALMHQMSGPIPPGYPYAPSDYTPGGMPQPPHPGVPIQQPPQQGQQPSQTQALQGATTRALSNSKRAEQNRKAQRAFRERRDQHVKTLESRSGLLDAALASADEANRRWEECRALVDQLRIENAGLRAALEQSRLLPPNFSAAASTTSKQEEHRPAESALEPSTDSTKK